MTIFLITLVLVVAAFVIYVVFKRRKPKVEEKISILVPFSSKEPHRVANWAWLASYLKRNWPAGVPMEIIVGDSKSIPFCKTAAVNGAFSKATGDIIVILDADCYIDPGVIIGCALAIREARRAGKRLWFLPYRRLYRLTEPATEALLASSPKQPIKFTDPPLVWQYEHTHSPSSAHWWAALIQILPIEAFIAAGGMDERFKGWGGEDVSFMHAVDTLYGRHKTVNSAVFHLWHPVIPGRWQGTRQWPGQNKPEINDDLARRYDEAVGDLEAMLELVDKSRPIR